MHGRPAATGRSPQSFHSWRRRPCSSTWPGPAGEPEWSMMARELNLQQPDRLAARRSRAIACKAMGMPVHHSCNGRSLPGIA
jgi:hypothetical protein